LCRYDPSTVVTSAEEPSVFEEHTGQRARCIHFGSRRGKVESNRDGCVHDIQRLAELAGIIRAPAKDCRVDDAARVILACGHTPQAGLGKILDSHGQARGKRVVSR